MISNKPSRQRSREHQDRGSILIFVVGILVLLALAATAYLSTARNDRVTSAQNANNTQIELLLEGVQQAVIAKIVADPSIPTDLRTAAPAGTSASYLCDSPIGTLDSWLATRVPVLLNPSQPFNPLTNPPIWRFTTAGIFPGNFEDPTSGISYANRGKASPSPTLVNGRPALGFAADGPDAANGPFAAADADGDGIPDSPLIRLPVGRLNGLTYYAAIRVIDHSSALNANTALSRDTDYDGTGAQLGTTGITAAPVGMFTTSVGLREFLRTYDSATPGNNTELAALTTARLGGTPSANVSTGAADATSPYRSLGDKLYHDLGRRIDSPAAGAAAISSTDEVSLDYKFTLRDPTASQTVAESALTSSVIGLNTAVSSLVPTMPFQPTQVTQWFQSLFDYSSELAAPNTAPYWRPRRALITVHDPQGMRVRGADMDALMAGSGGAGAVGSGGTYTASAGPFASVVRYGTDMSVGIGERMHYYAPYSNRSGFASDYLPYRCSVNTAAFPELWRAFWNVMCDPTTPSAFPTTNTLLAGAHNSVLSPNWGDRASWTNTHELMLRSALAAVNVESLRSGGRKAVAGGDALPQNAVICRSVKFTVNATGYNLKVFGQRRQPFITQTAIITNGAGATGFEVIELYNPYDVPIALDNWQLIALTPAALPANGYTPTLLAGTPEFAGKSIAAHGFCTISSGPVQNGVTIAATVPLISQVTAPLLATSGSGLDVMLVRPRRGDGVLSADDPTTPDTIEPDEGTPTAPNLANFVPVDRVPALGTAAAPAVPVAPVANMLYLRQRPNLAATPWQFTYEKLGAVIPAQPPATAVVLGDFNTVADLTWPTTQIDNVNWPANTLDPSATAGDGVDQTGANIPMRFPYGGFSRLGEILQAPFMGSWTLSVDVPATAATTFIDSIPEPFDAYNCNSAPAAGEDVGRFFTNGAIPVYYAAIFDFFTCINHPWDDYDFDAPSITDPVVPTPASPQMTASNYGGVRTELKSVGTPGSSTSGPVQGLININTSPQKVLAALPWMPAGSDLLTWNAATQVMSAGADGINDDEEIASAIVYYRDNKVSGGQAFQFISDLQKVTDSANTNIFGTAVTALLAALEPDDAQGDWTPLNPHTNPRTAVAENTDLVRNDFEEKALLLTRVSNLISTRSDTFTVYIDLQGWRDAGTSQAKLIVERHAAMIVDRSQCSPSKTTPDLTKVPAN